MGGSDLVTAQGIRDTQGALRRWNADPGPVLLSWVSWSLVVAVTLLSAVWVVAGLVTPDPTPVYVPGISFDATATDVIALLGRNSLVLALHATACVAGFIAGSSLRRAAATRSGPSRWVHEKAGPLAIGFVVCVTTFSLITQAYALGLTASTLSAQLQLSPAELMLTVLPHAVPELVALFLPLAAWLVASRRDQWQDLLGATVVTVALAVPILVVSAVLETFAWPELLVRASPALV